MRFQLPVALIICLALAACAELDENTSYRASRPIWAAVGGRAYQSRNAAQQEVSDFIQKLAANAVDSCRGIKDYPKNMTRVTVRVSFDGARHLSIVDVKDAPNKEVEDRLRKTIEESYSKLPIADAAYPDFSKIDTITFIFT